MPYKDPARQAAAQRRYRAQRIEQAREKDRLRKSAARAITPQRQYGEGSALVFQWDLDLQPEHARSCNHRFFAHGRCRKRAEWVSLTATRWCDEHAEGLPDLRRIDGVQYG